MHLKKLIFLNIIINKQKNIFNHFSFWKSIQGQFFFSLQRINWHLSQDWWGRFSSYKNFSKDLHFSLKKMTTCHSALKSAKKFGKSLFTKEICKKVLFDDLQHTFAWSSSEGTRGVMKNFQKTLILAFDVIMQWCNHPNTHLKLHFFSSDTKITRRK